MTVVGTSADDEDAVALAAAAWERQWRGQPGHKRAIDVAAATHVVAAVLAAVTHSSRVKAPNPVALEEAGQRWGIVQQPVADLVTQLSVLRGVLAQQIRADRSAIDRAVDQVAGAALGAVVARVEQLSRTDPLTGIGNRRAFDDAVRSAAAIAARQGHSLTMVVADLDGLKQINDRYGHDAGDGAIVGLTKAFASVLRTTDTMFRIGGDEFVLLLPFTEPHQVQRLMDRVTDAGAPAFTWGAAALADHGGDLAGLFGEADVDLYRRRRSQRSLQPAVLDFAPLAAILDEQTVEHGHGGTPWRWAWVAAAAVVLAAVAANVLAPATASHPTTRFAAPPTSGPTIPRSGARPPSTASRGASSHHSHATAPSASSGAALGNAARTGGPPGADRLVDNVQPPAGSAILTGSTSPAPGASTTGRSSTASSPSSNEPPSPGATSPTAPGTTSPGTAPAGSTSGSGPVGSLVSAVGSILRPLPILGDLITPGPGGSTEVAGLVNLSGSSSTSPVTTATSPVTTSTSSTEAPASTNGGGLLGTVSNLLDGI